MEGIFINGRFFSQPMTGAQRYGHEVLASLDVIAGKQEVQMTLLVPRSVKDLPSFSSIKIKSVGHLTGQFWEQFELPFYARKGVLFTPCGGAPILHGCNVITIHDAAVVASPRGYSWGFRVWYKLLNWTLCRTARHVLTVSEFAKSELMKWYGARSEKVTVTYLGSEHALRPKPDPAVLDKHKLESRNYILSVGSNNPNKNFLGFLHSLSSISDEKIQVAIAGPRDLKIFGGDRVSDARVRDLGYVSDSELRTLYENAACFVFPSFYEGFGLPPLEALALGCPIVVSDIPALNEIVGAVAFKCDPGDSVSIGMQIATSLREKSPRELLTSFATKYSWQDCGSKTWEILSKFAR